MNLYLAGCSTIEDIMDVYLAGLGSETNRANSRNDFDDKIFVLESFHYLKDWMLPYIKEKWNFLLDSGAFTFMNNLKNSKDIDWDNYVEKYAKCINDNDIDLFFELDIDVLVGIEEVERLRNKLEKLTNKKCIPVWHKSRGLDYWKQMCKDYEYVAIGGIAIGTIKRSQYDIFVPLLKIAKESNCKVHGLGFSSVEGMKKYKFYSTDSTTWSVGNRAGFLFQFKGDKMYRIEKPKGTRLNGTEAAIHNFKEWIKFQKYAKRNL